MTGIRVSSEGVDARSALPFQVLLDERYPLFKVHMEAEDSIFLPGALSLNNKQIAHNLGYKPAIFVYGELKAGSGIRYLINGVNPFLQGSDEVFMYAYVDDTNLVVEIDSLAPLGSDKTFAFHYYITYEDLGV